MRVIKVGGSLFNLPGLGSRITKWIDHQPPTFNLLIAGGGKLVEDVRSKRDQNLFDESSVHWQCIDLMTATSKSLAEVLPGIQLLDSLLESDHHATAIFSPASWLREIEPNLPGTRLRESWDVSSDSIAARVAIILSATELVLLKSADPPSENIEQLAKVGYVDQFLPRLTNELPRLRIVNLRRTSGK